ncbi:metal-dependent amidase/aminoacylase/carboxypeptidase [Mytilinidion resinicola]|uniref:Peptidase M20 domain-containing protein 2 n=1 Tax=Mytilinidion resinicola TaxID=574789 RepID=A0A6A6Z6N8_9PEZI|nr:metal-dependent amidase/aminoacylase/carboxypeptidase [Mytilinidion resinicola]KAF2816772.1 metal-dependent amidase/aminoacylase/carboxypeptidase [Mytilinidion resinicola]
MGDITPQENNQNDTMNTSEIQQLINKSIENLDAELRDINHKIHSHPELGYSEHLAHDNIVALLQSQSIPVTPHAYNLPTSFEATYGRGGRLAVFNVEYDALPGIGHACGHNLIATGSLAAFFGVVALLKKHQLPGRVRALGTPAEEGGGGKIKLIDAGAYAGVDACLMTHPMSGHMFPTKAAVAGLAYGTSVASAKFRAIFTGRTAHAAASPQDGVNALDAAVLAYSGISMLRQQILPAQRIHGIILEDGEKANVIPARSLMDYNVRGATLRETKVLQERVVNCFKGAAVATGCEVEFEETNNYAEVVPNRALCTAYSKFMLELGAPQLCEADKEGSEPHPGSYSTDQGNVSQVCPGFHPVYNIPTDDGASNHTKEFTKAAISDEAYRLTIQTAQGMAATAWKLLTDDNFAGDVKADFERDQKRREGS